MDVVRLGIVGSGYMGRTYAHCVRDHNEGVELAGVTQGSRAPRLATGGDWRDIWEMPKIEFLGDPFEPRRLEAFFVQTQDFVDSLRYGRPPAVRKKVPG